MHEAAPCEKRCEQHGLYVRVTTATTRIRWSQVYRVDGRRENLKAWHYSKLKMLTVERAYSSTRMYLAHKCADDINSHTRVLIFCEKFWSKESMRERSDLERGKIRLIILVHCPRTRVSPSTLAPKTRGMRTMMISSNFEPRERK